MSEVEKKFEMIDGVIHYREYKFEMVKDAVLSEDDYRNKKTELMIALESIREQINDLHDKETSLEKDLELFERFDVTNSDVFLEEVDEEDSTDSEDLDEENDSEEVIVN